MEPRREGVGPVTKWIWLICSALQYAAALILAQSILWEPLTGTSPGTAYVRYVLAAVIVVCAPAAMISRWLGATKGPRERR